MKREVLALVILASSAWGCGTTVGNPAVTLKNKPYDNDGTPPTALALPSGLMAPSTLMTAMAAPLAVTELKFCNTQIKFENEAASVEEVESRLGLIDASNAAVETVWGEVAAPADSAFDELSVELHYDPEVCGVGYSILYEGTQLTADLEFNFKFASPITVAEGDVLALGMTVIATALEQARIDGKLNDVDIADYINETVEDDADHEED